MGIAPSLPPAAELKPWDAAAVAARQRSFEFFESLDPGRTFRWVQHAWFMYKLGGGVERARPVFRAALAHVADYDYIYSAWTNMEELEGAAAAARELFEEWRARRAAAEDGGGGERDQEEAESWFWRHYLAFELEQGDAERARAVAEAAVAARPGDVMLRAKHVLAEMLLGDDERARAAFERALAAFAADPDAEKRLTEEVRRGGSNLSEKSCGGCLLFFCRGRWFFQAPWWEQI